MSATACEFPNDISVGSLKSITGKHCAFARWYVLFDEAGNFLGQRLFTDWRDTEKEAQVELKVRLLMALA